MGLNFYIAIVKNFGQTLKFFLIKFMYTTTLVGNLSKNLVKNIYIERIANNNIENKK